MRLPKVEKGLKRFYYRCEKRTRKRGRAICGKVYYRDAIPHSLSNPILTLGCGHSFYDCAKGITRAEFYEETR
jgi:hypothetical protein